ncbi:MAG: helix-turn-helix domain-containing protein [Lachnospiraceae bacterium]|nr:helix-turn-helix domain-containing protein [Lachnospiraceae bacterium]
METENMGSFISELRHEKGWTQKELAERVGVSDKAVSKWERGHSIPDISTMTLLCKELEITINELLSGQRLSSEDYDKKAEENMMKLMEENEKGKSNSAWNIIGTVLGFCSVMIILALSGISAGGIRNFSFYMDGPSLVIVFLLLVFILSAAGLFKEYFRGFVVAFTGGREMGKGELEKIYWAHHYGKLTAVVAGVVVSIGGIVVCLNVLAEAAREVLLVNLSMAMLGFLYGAIFFAISLFVELKVKLILRRFEE